MGRFDTAAQADAFVDALPARTRTSLGPALAKRVDGAKLDPANAFAKELRKRLHLEYGEERPICWSLVRRGLVDRQLPPLWLALADGFGAYPSCASSADVLLLLSGVTDPGATEGGLICCLPHWSCALDRICFVGCGADLAPLKTFWQSTTGLLRTGLATVLARGGLLRREELDDDWASLLAVHYREYKKFGGGESTHDMPIIWPAHPDAVPLDWHPPHVTVVSLWDRQADSWSPAFEALLEAFTTRDAYARSLSTATPPKPRRPAPRRTGRAPAKLGTAPSYAEVVWVFGRRVRSSASAAERDAVAREMAEGAMDRKLAGDGRYGVFVLPIGGEGELCVGVILNGSPIVRDAPEMRENVFAKVHAAVGLEQELVHSGENTWQREVADLIDETMATDAGKSLRATHGIEDAALQGPFAIPADEDLGGVAWHLAARTPGSGGAVLWGTFLPNDGGSYEDDVVRTIRCRDADGTVVARLVGATVLRVNADRAVATLTGPLAGYSPELELWQRDLALRIERLTGKPRPCRAWLASGSSDGLP